MHVGWFDEAVRPPEGLSRRIARNMQLLLRDEFHLLQPLDPAGGSWYVEALTQQLAERAWDFLQRIEAEGGMVQALQSGLVQREIGDVFAERLKNLDFRTDRAVGVNMYADLSETPLPLPETDRAAVRESRRRAVATYRELMDDLFRRERLGVLLDQVSGPPGAFLDALVEAFLAGASLSEVREVLDDGFSGDVVVSPLRPHRWTEKYEALRRRTEEAAARTGRTFRVFLANMGPLAQHKARADFSAAFMEVAGFQVLRNDGFATVEEAVQAAAASEADVAVLCSTDETYPELVPPLAAGIKAARPDMAVLLAGAPAPEHKEDYVRAGVDEFIHLRANCYAVLDALLRARGIC
jgi:methylmalonyl-CoA mutase